MLVTHAIHIVKQLAQQATPRLRLRERIVRHQIEAVHVALQMQHQSVVAGTVIGFENIDVGHHRPLIARICRIGRGNKRAEQISAAGIGEGAVAVISLLVHVIGARKPMFVERVLHAAGSVNGIGCFVT